MSMNSIPALSIVICTYAPEEKIFARVLRAVAALQIPDGFIVEGIIVDNNSPVPITELSYVKNVLSICSWLKVIVEYEPGLTYARLAGTKVTQAPWVIFFDDDNEPRADYLYSAIKLVHQYATAGILGPGIIAVEYTDPVSPWFEDRKSRYQQKSVSQDQFSSLKGWQACYPPGTGQIVKRAILEEYAIKVMKGELSSKDRTGKSLASAGDVQIVYTALGMGYTVGISPLLQVNHLISGRKTTMYYAKRHTFGTASSYCKAHLEIYPEDAQQMKQLIHSAKTINQMLRSKLKRGVMSGHWKDMLIDMATYTGEMVGLYRAFQIKEPWILRKTIQCFRLE